MRTSSGTRKEEIRTAFDLQSENQWRLRRSTAADRISRLQRLRDAIESYEAEILSALHADLRRVKETSMSEIAAIYKEIDDAAANLPEWMKPVDIEPSSDFSEISRACRVVYEPKGVVLLFAPWNFPFALLFMPLVSIVAAGNTALVKPNEVAPSVSAISSKIVSEVFPLREVAAFEGGVDLANELLELPIDHVFFTGSPAVGKTVMAAAAKHLASVTLELGGKNPVIIDGNADIADVAGKLALMRTINSGQVCLCPENVWIREDKKDEFVQAVAGSFRMFYDDEGKSDKLNLHVQEKIINKRNLDRIRGYLEDAKEKGAVVACGGDVVEDTLSVHPTILTDIPRDARILSEEVFGPILSVFTYEDVAEVYKVLQKEPKPLALYVFSQSDDFVEDAIANTTSGGVTVNHCMMHCAEHNLPFGGVGNSGTGRYHSIHGFKEVSNARSMLHLQ